MLYDDQLLAGGYSIIHCYDVLILGRITKLRTLLRRYTLGNFLTQDSPRQGQPFNLESCLAHRSARIVTGPTGHIQRCSSPSGRTVVASSGRPGCIFDTIHLGVTGL